MPSRRKQIAMDAAEIQSFLESEKAIVLTTLSRNGFPHPIPMLYHCDADGSIWMTSYARAAKVRNLERDPRASLLVERSGPRYEDTKAVIIQARVEIVRDVDAVIRTFRAIGLKGIPDVPIQDEAAARRTAEKRVALRCIPQGTISWDHGKLGGVY